MRSWAEQSKKSNPNNGIPWKGGYPNPKKITKGMRRLAEKCARQQGLAGSRSLDLTPAEVFMYRYWHIDRLGI